MYDTVHKDTINNNPIRKRRTQNTRAPHPTPSTAVVVVVVVVVVNVVFTGQAVTFILPL